MNEPICEMCQIRMELADVGADEFYENLLCRIDALAEYHMEAHRKLDCVLEILNPDAPASESDAPSTDDDATVQ